MSNSERSKTYDLVLAGLFAAITFLGVQVFRIQLPAAVGAPFIHFGNALVVLSVLMLGFKYGALAGAMGLGIFDMLNGYASFAIFTITEAIIVAAVVSILFNLLGRNDKKVSTIIVVAIAAGVTKIIESYVEGIIVSLIAGTSFKVASIASFASLYVTVINSISTVILVSLLYYPMKKIMERSLNR